MSEQQIPSDLTPAGGGSPIDQPGKQQGSKWFFFRRRPKLQGVPRDWSPPPADEYARNLIIEGFISPSLIDGPLSRALSDDISELEEHLLPHFWRLDQQAKYYQNRYYLFQWIFIWSAFLTTTLAALNVYLHGAEADPATRTLGLATALISGLAAAISFLGANESPQQRWFKSRSQAESLRSLYFLFLARQAPFNITDRQRCVQMLRYKVVDVLKELYVDERRKTNG